MNRNYLTCRLLIDPPLVSNMDAILLPDFLRMKESQKPKSLPRWNHTFCVLLGVYCIVQQALSELYRLPLSCCAIICIPIVKQETENKAFQFFYFQN